MNKIFAFLSFLALSSLCTFPQSSSTSFDVASIKPSDPNSRGFFFRNRPGLVDMSGATVLQLIQQAYNVRESQISGGPGWINSDRYDIVAKVGDIPADPQNPIDQRKATELQRERMRALLADRFQLKIRRETKELPVYALILARGGPKLKESNPGGPAPAPDAEKGAERPRGSNMRIGLGQIMGQSVPLDMLVQVLSQQLGRIVVDKTGLKGTYDFTLEWTPDQGQGLGPGFAAPGEPPRPDSSAPAESSGPSVFSALQEQLGLKLESQKAPVEIIVIESVEKPSEN